jgi:type III secretion protein J
VRATAAEADAKGKKTDGANWHVTLFGTGEHVVNAWKILRENGLPREKVPDLEGVFSKPGLIPTAGEEKARMLVGTKGELIKTLRSVSGVLDAHVNIVIPEAAAVVDKKDQNQPTASVLVRYRGSKEPLSDDQIRGLVAKGVEGLSPENVNVVQKQEQIKPLPETLLGPFSLGDWTTMASLAFSGVASLGALSMMVVSKRRAYQIKSLEQRLAQLSDRGRLQQENG